MTMDELFFFDGKPEELALYETLLDRIKALGAFTAIAHKTQISLKNAGSSPACRSSGCCRNGCCRPIILY